MAAAATRSDARHTLLARLIDHAPTFPPARLPPREALAEDRRARESDASFMLGRLVWPASAWEALVVEDRALSVVLDAPAPDGVAIEAVELRHPGSLGGLAGIAPEVYVEVPVDSLDELPALAEQGLRGKVRCGGERVPSVADLAAFVSACRAAGLPFKATAGLHHPVRSGDAHGFLNLLAAAIFEDEERALAETDAASFRLRDDVFAWRDSAASLGAIAAGRGLLVSFGSCSFFEPVEELRALELL